MGRRAPPKSRPLRAGRSLNAVTRPERPGEPGAASPGGELTSAGLISIGKRARLNPVSDPRPLEKCREEVRRIELRTGVLGKIGEKQEVVVFIRPGRGDERPATKPPGPHGGACRAEDSALRLCLTALHDRTEDARHKKPRMSRHQNIGRRKTRSREAGLHGRRPRLA